MTLTICISHAEFFTSLFVFSCIDLDVAIMFSTNFLYSSRSFHHQKRIYNIYNAFIEYYVTNCAHHINCNDK